MFPHIWVYCNNLHIFAYLVIQNRCNFDHYKQLSYQKQRSAKRTYTIRLMPCSRRMFSVSLSIFIKKKKFTTISDLNSDCEISWRAKNRVSLHILLLTSSSGISFRRPSFTGKPLPKSLDDISAPYSTMTSSSMLLTNLQNSFSTSSVGTI